MKSADEAEHIVCDVCSEGHERDDHSGASKNMDGVWRSLWGQGRGGKRGGLCGGGGGGAPKRGQRHCLEVLVVPTRDTKLTFISLEVLNALYGFNPDADEHAPAAVAKALTGQRLGSHAQRCTAILSGRSTVKAQFQC